MRRIAALTALAVLGATTLAAAGPEAARRDGAKFEPPAVQMRIDGKTQRSGLIEINWANHGPGGTCVGRSIIGDGAYPRPLRAAAPGTAKARFILQTPREPRHVRLTAWRAVDENGVPVGPSEDLPVLLSAKHGPGGQAIAWRATTSVTPPPGYFIDLYADWPTGRCGDRWELLTFHIGGRPQS